MTREHASSGRQKGYLTNNQPFEVAQERKTKQEHVPQEQQRPAPALKGW